ncbi:PucR family transcriptional regulator [Kitasatospora herbaricolor]|uniref:PucR family transcriptional regulator n=1 Tax=Kitasatospora herbaricolor TaxID=68217 RepID=A0ABZ1WFD5_9ACTN|nr:PucR family transcriptional regulator [Kitasatospora herbaricolor]
MIVGDLLHLDDLDIRLAWGTPELLARQITGVTSTDLQDPARYLQPGELVLTGLVWWQPEDGSAALRFATALRSARVAALMAGEGTHGAVPASLAEACRTHGIPLLAVPSGTSFRAVTDRVYLRLWGGLQAGVPDAAAIPEAARRELAGLIHSGAQAAEVLAHAVSRLGVPECSVSTTGGRVIAEPPAAAAEVPAGRVAGTGSGTGSALPVGPQENSPFDGWLLHGGPAAEGADTPMLRGLADLLAPLAARAHAEAAARRQAAGRLLGLLAVDGPADLAEALAACGLPAEGPLVTVAARIDGGPDDWAAYALAEALHPLGVPFAAGTDPAGRTAALVAAPAARVAERLRRARSALQARLTGRRSLRAGVGPASPAAAGPLRAALVQARYVLAGAAGPIGSTAELDSLAGLLRGIPPEVTAAFHSRLLAPLAAHDGENAVSLLGTLTVFLDHDGSWARTAESLHIHVNTVHYRIRRIEELTGRNLARLQDRLDLRAALLCAPAGR